MRADLKKEHNYKKKALIALTRLVEVGMGYSCIDLSCVFTMDSILHIYTPALGGGGRIILGNESRSNQVIKFEPTRITTHYCLNRLFKLSNKL
jgi:hypothetical protein